MSLPDRSNSSSPAAPHQMFERMLRIAEWPRHRAIATTATAGALLAAVDWWSGPMFRPTVGYLLLVILAAWMGRRYDAVGLGVALIGFDELIRHRHPEAFDPATRSAEMWALLMAVGVLLVLVHVTSEFRNAIVTLHRSSRLDALTGLLNTAAFKQAAEGERARAAREGYPVSVAFLDLDHLKQINDRLGHSGGDRVIRTFAAALDSSTRPYDLVGRLGGDEFALFLPRTDEFAAAGVVARLRSCIAAIDDDGLIGVSIGIATYYSQPEDMREMVTAADCLMYEGKRQGRNRTVGRVVLPRSSVDDANLVIDVDAAGDRSRDGLQGSSPGSASAGIDRR